METTDIVKAILFLRPTAQFSFEENDYSTVKWDVLEGDAPTWEEVIAANSQVKAKEEQDALNAKAKREAAIAKLEVLGLTAEDLKALGL